MKTSTGFEYEIDTRRLKTLEAIETLIKLKRNGDNPDVFTQCELALDAANCILGEETVERLRDHCRTEFGTDSIAFMREVTEIFSGNEELKK